MVRQLVLYFAEGTQVLYMFAYSDQGGESAILDYLRIMLIASEKFQLFDLLVKIFYKEYLGFLWKYFGIRVMGMVQEEFHAERKSSH